MKSPRECRFCGCALAGGFKNHETRCAEADQWERDFYRKLRRWPRPHEYANRAATND